MTAKELLKERHKKAMTDLNKLATPVVEEHGLNKVSNDIGKTLGVSFQTVINYIYGRVKDGFLCEAITKEIKKYK